MSNTPPRDPAEDIFEDLRAWARGEIRPPFRLFAYLTERCNLRCPSCGLATGEIVAAGREMDDETVLCLAEQAAEIGVRECYLTGGEVLVRKPLVLAFMERIAAAGIRGVLSTNGTLLDEEDVARVAGSGWHLVIVSLDGPDPCRNDPLRGRAGVFDRATDLIRTLVSAREGGQGPEVHLHTVVSRANADQLTAMVELCAELGVDYFAAEPIVRQSDACDALLLDDVARRLLVDEAPRALARAGELGLSSNLGFLASTGVADAPTDTASLNAADVRDLEHPFAAVPCYVPFYNLVVHPDGALAGCWQGRDEGAQRFPDVSLAEAWERHAPARLRAEMLAGSPPEHCRMCCLVNARDNRRYRALLLAELGEPSAARAALRTAIAAEPELDLLGRARARLLASTGGSDGS